MESSTPALKLPSNIMVIGCGGVASYLMPCLLKLMAKCANAHVILVDGDTLEERNLDRQLFSRDLIGTNKAEALWKVLGSPRNVVFRPEYFTHGTEVEEGTLLLVCADNHAARKAALMTCDDRTGCAIVGGNEYTDAEAYFYNHQWHDSPLDPRIYFPEINTDKTGDPTRPQGCQGEAQIASPQLALANMSAANHMLWLMWFYFAEASQLKDRDFWPVRHCNSFSRFGTTLLKDANAAKKEAA